MQIMKSVKYFMFVSALAAIVSAGCSDEENVSVRIEESAIEIEVGQKHALRAVASDGAAIGWRSENPEIANVSAAGLVTGLSEGTTDVVAVVGGAVSSCAVTVVAATPESLSLDVSSLNLVVGDVYPLKIDVVPSDTEFVCESSDEKIVAVDAQTGVVTAVGAGEATVTVVCGASRAACSVSVTAAPEIGDFYYADGTWSGTLDPDKTPVAVVFYAENPSADDAALRREKPWCTHGLAVALNGIDGYGYAAWQSNYERYGKPVGDWIRDNTFYETTFVHYSEENWGLADMLLGYNNTKGIEAFNNVPEHYEYRVDAVQYVVDYRKKVPAPETSSDWYLPCPKELKYLGAGDHEGTIELSIPITALHTVNERVEEAGGIPVEISSRPYITSTESVSGYAHVCLFSSVVDECGCFDSPKKEKVHNIRAILAF